MIAEAAGERAAGGHRIWRSDGGKDGRTRHVDILHAMETAVCIGHAGRGIIARPERSRLMMR